VSRDYDDTDLATKSRDELVEIIKRQQEEAGRVSKNFFVWLGKRGVDKPTYLGMGPSQQLALANAHEHALYEQKVADEQKVAARRPAPNLPAHIAELPLGSDLRNRLELEWANAQSLKNVDGD